MKFTQLLKPTQNLNGGTLDARVTKRQGKDLYDLIMKSVERQSKWNVTYLPDRLILTQKQFASLNNFTEAMYNTTDRMFITPFNVMECIIDREIDTIPELDEIIEDAEEYLAEVDKKIKEEKTDE